METKVWLVKVVHPAGENLNIRQYLAAFDHRSAAEAAVRDYCKDPNIQVEAINELPPETALGASEVYGAMDGSVVPWDMKSPA
jgi:hypothetical protein